MAQLDTRFPDVRSRVTTRIPYLLPLVSFAAVKDTSHHRVRRTKRKAFTQMEVAVNCVAIHHILQKTVDYENKASLCIYTGFAAEYRPHLLQVTLTVWLYWEQVAKPVRTRTIFTSSSDELRKWTEGRKKRSK